MFYVREKLFGTNNITGLVAILHDVISSLDKTKRMYAEISNTIMTLSESSIK
jgi:hypothetical protein